jgi:predicted glycosyltransferase
MTASAHPLVFRPLVEILTGRGDEVEITARDYAQTLQLIESHGMTATPIGHHGGRSRLGKARQLSSRLSALKKWARGRDFDVALAHGSHELTITAHRLGIPSSTTFDYEFAWLQHQLGCRAATKVVVPDSIPIDRLAKYGAVPPKLLTYEGLKEEYYLAGFEPDPAVLGELGLDTSKPLAVVRTPPAVSLYHRFEAPLFGQVLDRLRGQQVVVLPRVESQRAELGGFIVPERAIDAQSLMAFADLVISAGGTMNREAVALGTPVWTTFEGRLGAVDERLIADGRLRKLTRAEDVVLEKRPGGSAAERIRRDPETFTDLFVKVG